MHQSFGPQQLRGPQFADTDQAAFSVHASPAPLPQIRRHRIAMAKALHRRTLQVDTRQALQQRIHGLQDGCAPGFGKTFDGRQGKRTAKIKVGDASGQFFVNVTNLFDRDPILLPETGLSANSTFSDLLGRSFRVGVRFKTN